MIAKFKALCHDESGATAIEYGLIAALVSVAAVTALTNMGASLSQMFTNVSNTLNGFGHDSVIRTAVNRGPSAFSGEAKGQRARGGRFSAPLTARTGRTRFTTNRQRRSDASQWGHHQQSVSV